MRLIQQSASFVGRAERQRVPAHISAEQGKLPGEGYMPTEVGTTECTQGLPEVYQ